MNSGVWIVVLIVVIVVAGADVLVREVCRASYRSMHRRWLRLVKRCRIYAHTDPEVLAARMRARLARELKNAEQSLAQQREGGGPLPLSAMVHSSSLFDDTAALQDDATMLQAAYAHELNRARTLVNTLTYKQQRWAQASAADVVREVCTELRNQVRRLCLVLTRLRRFGRWLSLGMKLAV